MGKQRPDGGTSLYILPLSQETSPWLRKNWCLVSNGNLLLGFAPPSYPWIDLYILVPRVLR